METIVLTQNIWLTYFTDKEVSSKILKQHQFIYPALEKLDCKDYSQNIENLMVILMAVAGKHQPEPDRMRYRRKKKELEIRMNLDYEKVLKADAKETLFLIINAYLEVIQRFLSQRKDFDAQKFYDHAQNLFLKKGWLETENQII